MRRKKMKCSRMCVFFASVVLFCSCEMLIINCTFSDWLCLERKSTTKESNTNEVENGKELIPNNEKKESIPNNEKKESVPNKEKKESVPDKEKKESVPNKEKKESVPNKEKKESIPNNEKKESVPDKEKKESVPNKEKKESIPEEKPKAAGDAVKKTVEQQNDPKDKSQICPKSIAVEKAMGVEFRKEEVITFPSAPIDPKTGVYKRMPVAKLNRTSTPLVKIDEELKALVTEYMVEIREAFTPLSPGYRNPCKVTKGAKAFCLPKFYVLTAPKCGSMDFWYSLVRHPMVFSSEKETSWWARSKKTKASVQKYASYFEELRTCIMTNTDPKARNYITGDGSTTNMWQTADIASWLKSDVKTKTSRNFNLADTISSLTPDAKLIFLLRNPVDRLYSEYWFSGTRKSAKDFDLQVKKLVDVFRSCLKQSDERKCAYTYNIAGIGGSALVGMYHIYVQDWLRRFPSEQVLFLRSEDWFAGQKPDMLLKAYHFLDIDVTKDQMADSLQIRTLQSLPSVVKTPNSKSVFEKVEREPMLDTTRKLLKELYGPSNKFLAELTGDKGFLWKR